jgi:hypothetical protein
VDSNADGLPGSVQIVHSYQILAHENVRLDVSNIPTLLHASKMDNLLRTKEKLCCIPLALRASRAGDKREYRIQGRAERNQISGF